MVGLTQAAEYLPRFAVRIVCAAFASVAAFSPASAAEACRQALILGLDVSGSVDAQEYQLQI
ncbi:MAG: hypothetical protein AAGH17_08160, partial [Pseudomonadota bacterium]